MVPILPLHVATEIVVNSGKVAELAEAARLAEEERDAAVRRNHLSTCTERAK